MSRAGAPPRRSTGPVRAVDPRLAPPAAERRSARASALGPGWRATPAVLAGWTALAAIVVAGQLLAPDRRAGAPVRHGTSPRPGLATGPDAANALLSAAGAGAPAAPWYETLGAPRAALLPAPAVGPRAPGLHSPLAPASTAIAAPGRAPSAASVAVVAVAGRTPAAKPAALKAEHPPLRYLGGEHRFESPLIMPRLREGLRVNLPYLAKLPTVGRLFARPSPGEPVPVLITAYCLKGTTRRGNEVRTGIVAADPRVFPLARHVELYAGGRFLGRFLVDDTGGKIKGQRIDIWTPDCADALRFGARRGVATLVALSEVRRVARGKGE